MASKHEAEPIVFRCGDCGKVVVRDRLPASKACPECGGESLDRVAVVGGAIGYSLADRRRGPSIEDSRLGRMAYFAGWMTLKDITQCLRQQKKDVEVGRGPRKFGEIAVAEDFLSDSQVEALLRIQAIHNGPSSHDYSFGALALHEGFITHEELDECLLLQKSLLQSYEEAPALGILMIEKKYLDAEQVKRILEVQAEHGVGPLHDLVVDRYSAGIPAAESADDTEAPPRPVAKAMPKAEELVKDRVLCRCAACGESKLCDSWESGDVCPACGAPDFSPVPMAKEDESLALTEDPSGPSIEDTRVGRLAHFAGWLNQEQVRRCVERQAEMPRQEGEMPRFGAAAMDLGLLTQHQVEALLHMQDLYRSPMEDWAFGRIAVTEGFVSQEDMDDCLEEQKRLIQEKGNAPFLGYMLIERRLIAGEQVKAILVSQQRRRRGLLHFLEKEHSERSQGLLKGLLRALQGKPRKAWDLSERDRRRRR